MADLSYVSSLVLHAIASGQGYGFQIMEAAGLPSGTVYPALRKLEKAKLIRSQWEHAAIARAGQRPPRRYYQITAEAEPALAAAALKYRLPEFTPKES
ncbi:MAG TPA: helix-turn-helix transcriptional regulator [Candidatus Sulfopaludibacter sp.]|jgi:DNA-binding PadR family transcriptional regulator|nr:helix-turn-helix transcriptional regulator [Candidatus Sulfopaludibacter sp.]